MHQGDWRPGTHNLALLVIQLIALWQASLRGGDYIGDRSPLRPGANGNPPALGTVEQAAPLWVWGSLFLVSTALVLIGLAGRWATPVIVGHVTLAGWYTGIGIGVLQTSGVIINAAVLAGTLLSLAGAWVMFRPSQPSLWLRLAFGVPAMLVGQSLLIGGLGVDYRTGTGLIAAAAMHATLGVGTFVLWQRQQLGHQVDDERAAVADTGPQ